MSPVATCRLIDTNISKCHDGASAGLDDHHLVVLHFLIHIIDEFGLGDTAVVVQAVDFAFELDAEALRKKRHEPFSSTIRNTSSNWHRSQPRRQEDHP